MSKKIREVEKEEEDLDIEAKVSKNNKTVQKQNNSMNLGMHAELIELNEKYKNKDDIFSMTLLTNPGYISSSRSIMFTSHLRQFRNILNPEFPRVFTNYENPIGHNSTAYYKSKHNYEVIARIPKFGMNNQKHLYLLFVYDRANDKYDVIEKKIAENLTEKFGFQYNNEVMDSKEEGDVIHKNEWLYKSTSYDEDNNYCYGRNSTFLYLLENHTIEDAIVVSKSFAESTRMAEVETRTVSLNSNDILLNLYGNNDNYKTFPDIGESIKNNTLCVKRRIHNNQVLYDLKVSNLRKPNYNSDTVVYCNDAEIIDLDIYCNIPIDEVPDDRFNAQLKRYLINQEKYYQDIFDICTKIYQSGSKHTGKIGYYLNKAKDILDPNMRWKDDNNSAFGNMIIEFTVKRILGLGIGQKITGRYGNKGVISEIRPDSEMPILDNGKTVDIIFNTLGVNNRLNSFQIIEQSITFICNRVAEKLKSLPTLKEKEILLFDIIGRFLKEQEIRMHQLYNTLSLSEKEEFFNDIYKDGIFIQTKPLWEGEKVIFDVLRDIYRDYKWIKPYTIFINKFGRKVPVLKQLVVGEMYVFPLKQTSSKGFSGRSNGNLSMKGVPEKPGTSKENRGKELYPKPPIRMGIDENYNSLICINEVSLAKMHLFYRNSPVGRRVLGKKLMTEIEVEDMEMLPEYKNRNAEILNAYFKSMGMKLNFNDKQVIKIYDGSIECREHDGVQFIGEDWSLEDDILRYEIEKEMKEDYVVVGSKKELADFKENRFEFIKQNRK